MSYFANLWSGIKTTAQGLSLTKQYFVKKGVYTLQYPEQNLPIDPVTHRARVEIGALRFLASHRAKHLPGGSQIGPGGRVRTLTTLVSRTRSSHPPCRNRDCELRVQKGH